MREFLKNEIKIVEWNIKETREYLSSLNRKYMNAIKAGNEIDIAGYAQRIEVINHRLNEQIHRLNDLRREWRYLDLPDDYCIHKETLDELSGMPRVSEAILILYH